MKSLRKLNRFIQAILITILPVVLAYWLLIIIKIQALSPITALLGSIFNPFISLIKFYVRYEVNYGDISIDFVPLIFAGIILGSYFVLSMSDSFLYIFEEKVDNAKEKALKEKEKRLIEFDRKKYLEDLALNKIIYLVLKFEKKESGYNYLSVEKDEDFFSAGILNTLTSKLIDASKEFKAKKYSDSGIFDNKHEFVFYNITDAIDYAFFVHNRVIEINKEILEQNKKLSFSIACHCAYSEETARINFFISGKMINLCSENEIVVSELFKNKYKALKEETNIKFDSRGLHLINDNQIEIYQVKI